MLRLLERANRLRGPDDPQRFANLPLLADALQFAGRLGEAQAGLDEVLTAPDVGPATRADALERIWVEFVLGASAAELRPRVEEALHIRRRLGEPAGIARALRALADTEGFIGRLGRAYQLTEEAVGYAARRATSGCKDGPVPREPAPS